MKQDFLTRADQAVDGVLAAIARQLREEWPDEVLRPADLLSPALAAGIIISVRWYSDVPAMLRLLPVPAPDADKADLLFRIVKDAVAHLLSGEEAKVGDLAVTDPRRGLLVLLGIDRVSAKLFEVAYGPGR